MRKLKKHLAVYMASIAVLTVGYICLLNAFFLFRSYGHVSVMLLGKALVVFASVSINSIGNSKGGCKELTVREMLGATVQNTYTLLVVEMLMLSLLAALLSLIILDLKPYYNIFLYSLNNNVSDVIDIIFLLVCVIFMSLLIGLFPTYRFFQTNISRRLRMN